MSINLSTCSLHFENNYCYFFLGTLTTLLLKGFNFYHKLLETENRALNTVALYGKYYAIYYINRRDIVHHNIVLCETLILCQWSVIKC